MLSKRKRVSARPAVSRRGRRPPAGATRRRNRRAHAATVRAHEPRGRRRGTPGTCTASATRVHRACSEGACAVLRSRELGPPQPRTSRRACFLLAMSVFSDASGLELWSIFSCVEEATDLLRCSHVNKEWRAQADDPTFWKRMCAKLWTGKAYVPRAFIVEEGASALPRKQAYFASIAGSDRSELRTDELCSFTWERLRNDAPVDLSYTERADPSDVKGDVCHFRPSAKHPNRGLMSSLPGEAGFGIGVGEDMRWIISRLVDRRTRELVTCLSNGPLNPVRRVRPHQL